jgi:DNA (cytosine-5)-methyltransferase 1
MLATENTFLEFFAGIGLMRLGLERAGWRVAFANDVDPQKREMYNGHFRDADAHFVLGDVHGIAPDQLPTATLATASFPCNDLSLAGSRDGLGGKQSSAFWGFVRVLEGMGSRRPPLVLLENVPGFLTSHAGADFQQALLALNRLGYQVDAFVLNAADFVPQSRVRLFVVGGLPACSGTIPLIPPGFSPSPQKSAARPKALIDYIYNHPEISWSLRDLPAVSSRPPVLAAVLDDLPDTAPEWWSADRAAYLLNQMSSRHRALADHMIAGSHISYGTVFRRVRHNKSMAELRADGIAGCLRTPRGGSGRQILFKAGQGKYAVRLLTPRECARLMGADDFNITVPLNQALFGFGDAVCVPVITWIAEHYFCPLLTEWRLAPIQPAPWKDLSVHA